MSTIAVPAVPDTAPEIQKMFCLMLTRVKAYSSYWLRYALAELDLLDAEKIGPAQREKNNEQRARIDAELLRRETATPPACGWNEQRPPARIATTTPLNFELDEQRTIQESFIR